MYGLTASPTIGPGRTSATCTVRSSRFSGFVRTSDCICARLSIWNTPTVSAAWISANTSGSSNPIRDRSTGSVAVSAIRSTHSSTADSMPSPSRSILRKPASEQESLSHWQIRRPSIAAGSTGTSSTSGAEEMTMPPECWLMWRGRPMISSIRKQEGAPAGRVQPLLGLGRQRLGRLDGAAAVVPAVGQLGHPLDLARRQRQRLAQVADRAPRPVGGEGGHQRGVLVP